MKLISFIDDGENIKLKRNVKIIAAVLAAAAAVALSITTAYKFIPDSNFKKFRNELPVSDKSEISDAKDKIHFLSTGSSDAILLESDGKFALIDCAEDTDNPRGFEALELEGYEDKVLEYLRKNAADNNGNIILDFVLGTHSHSDHIGGFDTIISASDVIVNRAYLKEYKENQINDMEVTEWDNQEVYDQMVNALNNKGVTIISQMDSTPFNLGNFTITLFNTTDDNFSSKVGENDNSLGVLVEKNGTRVFLSGDIDNVSGDEKRIAPEIGEINLLKVGHHSYAHSTSSGWLKTLNPKVCVVTNNYESIDHNTIRRITRISKSPILITGKENGVIAVIGDNGNIEYYNNIHN